MLTQTEAPRAEASPGLAYMVCSIGSCARGAAAGRGSATGRRCGLGLLGIRRRRPRSDDGRGRGGREVRLEGVVMRSGNIPAGAPGELLSKPRLHEPSAAGVGPLERLPAIEGAP